MKWVQIPGYPGVKANKDGYIKFDESGHETLGGVAGTYRRVSVVTDKKTKARRLVYVHDLICRAFHGKPKEGQVVLHLDDNKLNCKASNLRWGTQSENIQSAHDNGLINKRKIKQ